MLYVNSVYSPIPFVLGFIQNPISGVNSFHQPPSLVKLLVLAITVVSSYSFAFKSTTHTLCHTGWRPSSCPFPRLSMPVCSCTLQYSQHQNSIMTSDVAPTSVSFSIIKQSPQCTHRAPPLCEE